jgi:hypothetical protein
LPSIQVPTLLLYRREDAEEALDSGYLASHIRAARLVDLPGFDHFPWAVHQDATIREVERFLASVRAEEADLDRVLATVLFTDIVGSTEKANWETPAGVTSSSATMRPCARFSPATAAGRSTRPGTDSSLPSTAKARARVKSSKGAAGSGRR